MNTYDLAVCIPARNEEFLDLTIKDILKNSRANTQIIVVLDGYIPNPGLTAFDPRLTLIYNPKPRGQRGATNQAALIADAKYIMKADAHLAFDEGFDQKMLEGFKECGDDATMIPVMKNLHVFDWVCENGHHKYQGRDNTCDECKMPMKKEILWRVKPSPARFTFMFDKTMHFQYWGELAKRATGQYRETLSIQGSCFMITKERYFALDISSETDFNSWGQQGVEVACKTWLSGGRVIANLNTWYAHLFRTNNFGGFPYDNPQSLVDKNREISRELFMRNKWPLAKKTFQWLLDKFYPVPEWHDQPRKGMIYYTDNQLDENVAAMVRSRLGGISEQKDIPITTASLKKIGFGVKNIHFPSLKRGFYAMAKQILGALENSKEDIIFFTEHDIFYHPSHFDFVPQDKNTFYYNQNVWYVRPEDGFALHYDVNQASGICVYRETAIIHFRERLQMIEQMGIDIYEKECSRHMGFEPFTHNRIQWKNKFKAATWKSPYPNIDIRFGVNPTGMRWKKEQYRNQDLLINWQESTVDAIPGWEGLGKIVQQINA